MLADGVRLAYVRERPGTDAALETDDVLENIKEDRLQRVLSLNKKIQGNPSA